MKRCPACYDDRKGKHTCGHLWHREIEMNATDPNSQELNLGEPQPDPLPTEEELARELEPIIDNACLLSESLRFDQEALAAARFILSHLKPGGWKA